MQPVQWHTRRRWGWTGRFLHPLSLSVSLCARWQTVSIEMAKTVRGRAEQCDATAADSSHGWRGETQRWDMDSSAAPIAQHCAAMPLHPWMHRSLHPQPTANLTSRTPLTRCHSSSAWPWMHHTFVQIAHPQHTELSLFSAQPRTCLANRRQLAARSPVRFTCRHDGILEECQRRRRQQ